MKFGESLAQRSVAQWRSYNIDYAQLKRFIKDNTTPGNGRAVSVPGRGDELGRQFEDELFSLLQAECSRVSLFVRSKRYELESRLGSIERLLDQAERRNAAVSHPQKALRLRQRYSKIESDLLNVGEEIQKLSRFTSINRTAVRKLLKKHRKWSGNAMLVPRVESEILNKDDCFTKVQLQPCLERYAQFLERVRSPFTRSPSPGHQMSQSAAGTSEESQPRWGELGGSSRDFDSAFDARSRQRGCRKASFWVHKDNVTELKVLLLQYMWTSRRASVAGHRLSSADDLARKPSSNSLRSLAADERTTSIVLDNEPRLASPTNPGPGNNDSVEIDSHWMACKLMTFTWDTVDSGRQVLVSDKGYNPSKEPLPNDTESWSPDAYDDAWDQVQSQIDCGPIAQVNHRRTQLTGLENGAGLSSMATLDEEIRFSKLSPQKQLHSGTSLSFLDRLPQADGQSFPHAVLSVITRGAQPDTLISILDKSHLTERVNSFNIVSHALATLYCASDARQPSWFPLLARDIRHVPTNTTDFQRRQPTSSDRGSSASETLQGTPQTGSNSGSPPINATTTFQPSQQQGPKPKKQQPKVAEIDQQRYWSEYDHPESDADDGDGFAIYIDPDAPIFPGQVTLTEWYGSVRNFLSPNRRARLRKAASDESFSSSSTDEDMEAEAEADDELSGSYHPATRKPLLSARKRGYGSLPHRHQAHLTRYAEEEEADATCLNMPATSTLCLLASILNLFISAVLTLTSRKKLRGEVDIAVVIGVAASLCFAGVAGARWWGFEVPSRNRGNLWDNYTIDGINKRKRWREWCAVFTRSVGDVLTVGAMCVVVVGGVLLLVFAFR